MTDPTTQTANDNILPADAQMAIQQLIKLSRNLTQLAESETQLLVQNDMLGFAMLQQEKEVVVNRYVKASDEFQSRLNEFRRIDPGLLDQLENIQKDLGERSQSNNVIIQRMNKKSQEKTVTSLIAAQEIAQKLCVKFPQDQQGEKMA